MIRTNELAVLLEGKPILKKITVSITKPEFIAIIGPNGAGKSTFLKSLLGLIPAHSGEIRIKDKNLTGFSRKELARIITLIPQESVLQFDYTVEDIILMGRFPHLNYWSDYRLEDRDKVRHIMDKLQIAHLKTRFFNHLSGGEKQKVLIARALVQETDVILLDESLSFLDLNHQVEIMDLLMKIYREEQKTIVIVSHNINLSSAYSGRLLVFKDGQIVEDGHPGDLITREMIHRVFNLDVSIIHDPVNQRPVIYYSHRDDLK